MVFAKPHCPQTPNPQGADYETFKGVAQKIEDVVFVQTTDAAVAKAAGLTKVDTIAAVKNFVGEFQWQRMHHGRRPFCMW
jgi:hypothetical protein